MKITKYGHCCLLIEDQNTRVLTDPGIFSQLDEVLNLRNIDAVIITHEHADHLHTQSLEKILAANPLAAVITNNTVKELLAQSAFACKTVEAGGSIKVKNMLLEAYGTHHAFLHPQIPQIANTGYFFNGKLFYPGDALTNPKRAVEILAVPAVAPWIKISEAIDYVAELRPKVAFAVHDGIAVSPEMYLRIFNSFSRQLGLSVELMEIKNGNTLKF